MNSKLATRLAPWSAVIVVIGGCGSILYPIVQGTLAYNREEAPFRALGGYFTATGGGDMGITAGREGIGSIRLHDNVGDQELASLAPPEWNDSLTSIPSRFPGQELQMQVLLTSRDCADFGCWS
jgi:hypothetical protein